MESRLGNCGKEQSLPAREKRAKNVAETYEELNLGAGAGMPKAPRFKSSLMAAEQEYSCSLLEVGTRRKGLEVPLPLLSPMGGYYSPNMLSHLILSSIFIRVYTR